jgi:NAD(P)-dependent dehydrogenase (short-subunit alcohol dehydrogenase family)
MTNQNTRTIVITGGTGGIGYHSALGIAKTGARVIITGRNRERGEAAVKQIIEATGNDKVALVMGDVSSLAGVDALARDLLNQVERIDVLVNNAGYLGSEPKKSDDGFEMHFAVNVLAPWRLTQALLTALEADDEARVLNVAGGDKPAAVDVDNLQADKGFRGLMTYTHSKSVLEAMSMAMARALQPKGVTVHVVFPGRASTAMTRSLTLKAVPGLMKVMYPLFRFLFAEDGGKGAANSARSTIWAATTPELAGVTGKYFDTNMKEQKLHPTAYDEDVQARILAVLEAAAPSLQSGA